MEENDPSLKPKNGFKFETMFGFGYQKIIPAWTPNNWFVHPISVVGCRSLVVGGGVGGSGLIGELFFKEHPACTGSQVGDK